MDKLRFGPEDLRTARQQLGLTQSQLANALKLGKDGKRAVQRWEAGERTISGPVRVAVQLMLEKLTGKPE